MQDRRNNKEGLKAVRKKLRNNLTPAEAFLWNHLKRSQLDGRKFRRQHSVGNYILDFYCLTENLAIELDGAIHDDIIQLEYDLERENFLKMAKIRTLRFSNSEVFDQIDRVLVEIQSSFRK